MRKKKAKGKPEKIESRMQETAVVWYRGAKVLDIYTTNLSDITLLKRRGWEPLGGKEGREARPYLVFRIPKRALTFRSRTAVERKRTGPRRKKP